jgi:hypothetical protein
MVGLVDGWIVGWLVCIMNRWIFKVWLGVWEGWRVGWLNNVMVGAQPGHVQRFCVIPYVRLSLHRSQLF